MLLSFRISTTELSVAPNGSNGLQPLDSSNPCGHMAGLSVSPNGSNGLQHPCRVTYVSPIMDFQYPLTDRMDCNITVDLDVRDNAVLSVSPNGSNGLQPLDSSNPRGPMAGLSVSPKR